MRRPRDTSVDAAAPRSMRLKRWLVVVVAAALAGVAGTMASYSATTSSPSNAVGAGGVTLADNDNGVAMLGLNAAKPGDSDTSCIRVSSSGSIPTGVRLYGTVSGALASNLTLTVTRGTDPTDPPPSYDGCATFNPDSRDYIGQGAGVVYKGALSSFPASFTSSSVVRDPDNATGAEEMWSNGEVHYYRFVVTVDAGAPQGSSGTSAAFTWEARAPTYSSEVRATSGLAGYWRLGETSGTTAIDATGATNGTYVNGALQGQAGLLAADVDRAVSLDGSNDYVNVGNVHGFPGTAPFSVELWMNRTSVGEATIWRTIAGKLKLVAPREGWALTLIPDSDTFGNGQRLIFDRYGNGVQNNVVSTTRTQAGTAYHIVATYDGSRMKIYTNGALEGNNASSVSAGATTLPLRFGLSSEGSNPYGGTLDDVAIYGRALTALEVERRYKAGS